MNVFDFRNELVRDYKAILPPFVGDGSPLFGTLAAVAEEALRTCHFDPVSGLEEREWLRFIDERGLNLPTHAQYWFRECDTRVDFFYDLGVEKMAVFVDGPVHDDAERRDRDRDREVVGCLEDLGVVVARFGYGEDWERILKGFCGTFGNAKEGD